MGAYDCDCINNLEYDRRERKAQLSREGTTKDTTSDLISKTETVEHLRRVLDVTVPITDYDEGYVDGVEFGISTVSTMPPAQSQSTAGQLNDGTQSTAQSTDLIDRGQAIGVIEDYPHGNVWNVESMEEMVDKIKTLPTVPPEPTDIDAREAVYNLAEKIGIHQLFALTVELRGEPIQPEPHEGHWIGKYQTTHICSECGWLIPDSKVKVFAYCPNCGARMTISTK